MIKNYIKVAMRNMLKHKFYSFINVLGLSAGIICCLFIFLYVTDELSYDTFHDQPEEIYMVGLHGKIAGQEIMTSTTCPPLAAAIVAEIPGVAAATRVANFGNPVFRVEELAFTEKQVVYADSNFFEFFNFRLLEGQASEVLREPNTLVLTQDVAVKYFGNESPVGKTILVGNQKTAYKVTGVAANPPSNSNIQFAVLVSATSNRPYLDAPQWLGNSLSTYFRKASNASLSEIDQQMDEITVRNIAPQLEEWTGTSFEQFKEAGGIYTYFSEPLLDLHLRSRLRDSPVPTSDIMYVYVFSAIGAFILLIACINFMNLSTARSAGRAKEVGLRKTLGSQRRQLVGQFIAETVVYSFMAMVLAIGMVWLLLPAFNSLAAKSIAYGALLTPAFLGGALFLVFFIGILAGSYPALYLTAFSPSEVLKGKVRSGLKSKGVRSVLVVMQFSLSVFLIICTLVANNQLHFMQHRDMGIDRFGVVAINGAARLGQNQDAFKVAIEGLAGIEKSSYTNNVFPGINNTTVFRSVSSNVDHVLGAYYADYEQQEVLRLQLLDGRWFSRDIPSDSVAAVINEAAAREMGWENPLEEKLTNFNGESSFNMNVVGVIKDFNFESMKTNVRPMVIMLTPRSNNLLVRYQGQARDIIPKIEALWKENATGEPFEYTFLDENYDNLFREEQRMSTLVGIFTGLAILIACLGLFALASFTAEQRTKEIGIRKAMGASVGGLTLLLSREFTWLVLISIVLAVVPAYYVMNQWLSGFAYRIEMGMGIFLISSGSALAIAWITVSFQSLKAAQAKPVNSLRYE